MGMILRIASSRIVGQGDIVGRSGYFSLNLSANSVMRGRLDARRTLKSLVADLRIIEDGVAKMPDRSAFAGSVATTDRLVRTMIQLADTPLVDAVRMVTLTPARILHIDQTKGSIEAGKDADIVIFDNQINVINTISEGHVIYSKRD